MNRNRSISILVCLLSLLAYTAIAQDAIIVATWNVGLLDRSVSDLDLDDFAAEIDADVLVLNEVKTIVHVQEIRAALGREDDFIAIFSFENGAANLEVAIISRFDITDVVEFDRSPENNQSCSSGLHRGRLHRSRAP